MFGNYFKSTCSIPNLSSCMDNAIPIWTLLGITEEEYNQKFVTTQVHEPVVECAIAPVKDDKVPIERNY